MSATQQNVPKKPFVVHRIHIKTPPLVLPDDLAKIQDFKNVCRICGIQVQHVLPLYLPDGEKYDMVNKIRKYLPIKLNKNERMPQGICGNCAGAVLSWHELVRSARIADVILRRRLFAPEKPPEPRPSASSGSSVSRDGVTECLSWKINEIEEHPKKSCLKRNQIGEQSSSSKDVEKPIEVINVNGKRYVKCDTCEKDVATSSWQRHVRAHRGERRYSCHACGLAFSDSGNLARHARARHARLRPHVCPDCGRAFARNTHLQDHVRSHNDARDYVCDICGKTSKSATALRMHRRTHDAVCRFRCMECGSKFKRNAELRAHVTVHTGERAHLCGCGKAFRLRSQLSSHARTHEPSPIEPKVDGYVDVGTDAPSLPAERICTMCSLLVPTKSYNRHFFVNHRHRALRCEECHCYIDKDELLFHMNNHSWDLLPQHLKDEYLKNEKAHLAEDARIDALADIQLEKLNEVFRRQDERERIEKERAEQKKLDEQTDKRNEAVEEKIIGSEEPKEESLKSSEQKCDVEGSLLQRKTFDQPLGPDTEASPEKRQSSGLRTSPVKRQSSSAGPSPIKRQISSTGPSSVKRQSLAAGPLSGKRQNAADAESSPAKRQKKNKRIALAKSRQQANVFDDGNDGDDEVTSPTASSSGKVTKEMAESSSDKSPRASRTCPICGKQYRASSSYFYHMKYFHKRSREHECPVCNKKFGTKANLAQHARIHAGAYDLECKECGKRFKSKASLYIHEQSHGGPKLWKCSQCSRSFRWRTHLARHTTRHAAERAHVCGVCGRGFSVRCDLLRHARTHTADEFHCAQCGLKFAQKRYLQVHVMKKHPEAPPPPQVVTRS